jgi:hypothetical protein
VLDMYLLHCTQLTSASVRVSGKVRYISPDNKS